MMPAPVTSAYRGLLITVAVLCRSLAAPFPARHPISPLPSPQLRLILLLGMSRRPSTSTSPAHRSRTGCLSRQLRDSRVICPPCFSTHDVSFRSREKTFMGWSYGYINSFSVSNFFRCSFPQHCNPRAGTCKRPERFRYRYNALEVDGATYNVRFETGSDNSYDSVFGSRTPVFLNNSTGARTAIDAIAGILNSTTSPFISRWSSKSVH